MKADIFFFVTTAIVIMVGVLSLVILWYVLGIVRALKDMVERARRELVEFSKDIESVRDNVRVGFRQTKQYAKKAGKRFSIGRLVSFIINTVHEVRARRRTERDHVL